MTYIYFTDKVGGHLLTFQDFDRWCLGCDYDLAGDAYIYLLVAGNEYQICNSIEFTMDNPRLDSTQVTAYYTAVIRAIYEHTRAQQNTYLDLDAIRKDVLPAYWAKWQEAGYVDGEMPD